MEINKSALVALAVGLVCAPAFSDIILTGTGTFGAETFDTLAQSGTANAWTDNSTIANWYANPSSGTYAGGTGSGTTGDIWSFGVAGTHVVGDRALGALTSGSFTAGRIGFVLRNQSGGSLNLADIQLSFFGEEWRQNQAQSLVASYQTSSSAITDLSAGTWITRVALDFAAPITGTGAALDGNATANRTQYSNVSIDTSGTLANNDYLAVRWVKTGSNSPGLAIDDFSVTVVPEPTTAALIGLAGVILGLARRKVRALSISNG
jgi:hypothetical protein